MLVCYILVGILLLGVLVLASFDIYYFIRGILTLVLGRFFKKRIHVLGEATVTGWCLTRDIDTFFYHMNNSRFVRELDFARADFMFRSGIYQLMQSKKGSYAMSAVTIRYRRFIRIFSKYCLTSKIIYWKDQDLYMEHRFISPKDNFINAIAISKIRLINCSIDEIMMELLKSSNSIDVELGYKNTLEMSLELEKWIESNEISGTTLRGITSNHIIVRSNNIQSVEPANANT